MPAPKSRRRSRKRRKPGTAPRAAVSPRREPLAERRVAGGRQQRRDDRPLGFLATTMTGRTYGEPPQSPFGGLPISEIAIFAGAVGVVVGLASHGGPALLVGVVVCTLGVVEVTAREHFAGYRSHATLLAAVPPVAIVAASVALLGSPADRTTRELFLVAVVPVFAVLFWLLRKRFRTACQARLIRPPGA